MPHFLFAYHGGKQPDTPEETEVEIERWRAGSTGSVRRLSTRGTLSGPPKPYLPKA